MFIPNSEYNISFLYPLYNNSTKLRIQYLIGKLFLEIWWKKLKIWHQKARIQYLILIPLMQLCISTKLRIQYCFSALLTRQLLTLLWRYGDNFFYDLTSKYKFLSLCYTFNPIFYLFYAMHKKTCKKLLSLAHIANFF